MAESCAVAFGRYLRMLRERRGLSLDEVAAMSRSLADPVDKSYLSRCENGRYGIGFSKAMEAIGRNPEASGTIFVPYILGLALTEAIGIYALVVSLIILFAS